MKVKQVSVFMENTPGRLAEATKALGEADVNILALTIAETGEFGVLRMIVNDWKKAVAALKEKSFTTAMTDVLAVEIPNTPGSLAKIVDLFRKNDLNIEYVYAFVAHSSNHAVIVMRFEDIDKAMKLMEAKKIRMLSTDEVVKIAG